MLYRRSKTMRRYLIYIIVATISTLLMWGCSVTDGGCLNDNNHNGDRPTMPIKRRPIVPSTKLPRPRLISKITWLKGNTLAISLAERVPSAEVIVRDIYSGEEYGYIFEGDSITITIPTHSVEVEVCINDERYTYTIEEE